ncbi:MAG TPA: hypothetical protein VD838_13885, partial [Anaeromyxobacteraceae bacterium]|nr:hypothetical protein [Anaeromyxobacteraceae bacterium]
NGAEHCAHHSTSREPRATLGAPLVRRPASALAIRMRHAVIGRRPDVYAEPRENERYPIT